MGTMQRGLWIVHNGMGGELNRIFVAEPLSPEEAFIEMIRNTVLEPGDTFKIEEGESEA